MKIDPKNYTGCLERIAAKGTIGTGTALQLLQRVADHAETLSGPDSFLSAARAVADDVKVKVVENRLSALRNAKKRGMIMQDIRDAGGIVNNNAFFTLRSLLAGDWRGAIGMSIQSRYKDQAKQWLKGIDTELTTGNVLKTFTSGENDRDIAIEMSNFRQGKAMTTNEAARQVAEILVPAMEKIRLSLNDEGAKIGDAMDYVMHTLHDSNKLWRAGGDVKAAMKTPEGFTKAFQAWWDFAKPRLSEKTFEDITPEGNETMEQARDRFGRSVFTALATGKHMTPDGAFGIKDEGYVPPTFEGTYNLARSLSQQRVLFWKDGASWHEYMERFGQGRSMAGNMIRHIDQSAKHLALMERLGDNPSACFNQILEAVKNEYRNSDPGAIRQFENHEGNLKNILAQLDGTANIPVNKSYFSILSNLRRWEAVSMLGGVSATHFASIWPTITAEMAHHGISRMAAMGNMIKALGPRDGTEVGRELEKRLGAYSQGLSGDIMSRWNVDDDIPGRMSTIASTFMKWTGIHYLFDHQQSGILHMLSNELAHGTEKTFAELDPHLQNMLDRYGIGAEDWELIRKVPDLLESEGVRYLTPKDATRVDRAGAEALLRTRGEIAQGAQAGTVDRLVSRYQQQLGNQLGAYLSDAADRGVITPGARERAAIIGSTQPGTPFGELARTAAQFKMWPLAAYTQGLQRELFNSLSTKEATANIFWLLGLSTIGGYMGLTAKDIANGREPRNPLDPKTAFAALMQGGGLGIWGDYLFGEYNRFGGGLMSTLSGPVGTDAAQFYEMYQQFREDLTSNAPSKSGRFHDLESNSLKFLQQHTPFGNLIYFKGAADYLFWYHLYEAISPGWWDRMNRRMQKEQNRTMLGYRPGAPVPYNPFAQ